MAAEARAPRDGRLGFAEALFLLLACCGLTLVVLEPALDGPLISDDLLHFAGYPYMQELSLENVKTLLDPDGMPVLVTANWAPVHLLAHVMEREVFGDYVTNTYPYHVVNGIVHSLNATLFVALLSAHGVPLFAAVAAALLFLFHPANVEAVAWIVQLKTLLSTSFGLGALLLLRRRPALATGLFALGLLTKPTIAAVLAAAIVFEWTRHPGPQGPPRRTVWLFVWGAVLLVYGVIEFAAFRSTGEFQTVLTAAARALQAVAIAGRYLVLATTSLGASTFHQPPIPESVLDGWFALGLVTLAGAAWVCVRALRSRAPAAGWVGLAAAAYAPVAQIFPFRYPMADRYLYLVLLGLLGALAVASSARLAEWAASLGRGGLRAAPRGLVAAASVVAVLAVGFAVRSHARASVWSSADRNEADSIAHYPTGIAGYLDQARRAITRGDLEAGLQAIEGARRQGHSNAMSLVGDPTLQPLLGHPRYMELLADIAREWVAHYDRLPPRGGFGRYELAMNSLLMGDPRRALAALDGLEGLPGAPPPQMIQDMRRQVEAALRAEEASS
jgi:hypothetical protein